MNQDLYVVEKILMRRTNPQTGIQEYKVKWEGYSYAECTWEPFYNLEFVIDMVEEFNRQQSKQVSAPPKTHKIQRINKRKETSSQRSSQQNQPPVKSSTRNLVKKGLKSKEIYQSSEQLPSSEKRDEKVANQHEDYPQKTGNIVKNGREGSSIQEKQDEVDDYSDLEDDIEVLGIMQDSSKNLYFQVRFPQEIKWISHRTMKKRFPLELIEFYQRQMDLTFSQ